MALTRQERADALLGIIESLECSIADLHELGEDYEMVADTLRDIRRELNGELTDLTAEIRNDADDELAAQIADYWRSVL